MIQHGKGVVHDVTVTVTFSIPCETGDRIKNDGDIWRAIEAIKDNPKGWKAYTNGIMMLYANCGDLSTQVVQVSTYRED